MIFYTSCVCVCVCTRVCAQSLSCVWLCSPQGSSVHGIFQARILEWVTISSSRESSPPRDQTRISCVFCIGKWFFSTEPPGNPLCLKYPIKTLRRSLLCLFLSLFAHCSLPVTPVQSGRFWKFLSPWVTCISVRPKPSGTFPLLLYLICLWCLTLFLLIYTPPSLSFEVAS